MFQFSRFASMAYVFSQRYTRRCGFPHSEICGSKLVCQLPAAYRRLQRPSSPVFAKASTMCTYSLDPITMKAIGSMSFRACAVQSIVVFENLELKKSMQSQPVICSNTPHQTRRSHAPYRTHYLLCFFQIVKEQPFRFLQTQISTHPRPQTRCAQI